MKTVMFWLFTWMSCNALLALLVCSIHEVHKRKGHENVRLKMLGLFLLFGFIAFVLF